nr:hypothetical protein [Tanacetum cinerariifolium]
AHGVEVRLTMEIFGVVPIPGHTRVSYVGTILTMVMIVQYSSICDDDDDDEESIIPLNEIISQIPPFIAITPVLPTIEHTIKSSVPIPWDSEDTSNSDKECDFPVCDNFVTFSNPLFDANDDFTSDLVSIPKESKDTSDSDKECDFLVCDNFVTFSNPLFDANDDFTSSNEGVPEENVKIYSNPLFDFDDRYISIDVNPLFNEMLENIERIDSYVSNLDEPDFLVTPLFDANEDKCFDPKSLKDKPDNDDLKSMDKVFDPEIYEKIISLTYVRLPFEDRHYFSLTFVIRIFLPYLTYFMDSSLLLSAGSEDTIFDPGIFVFSFYSQKPVVSHRSGTFMCFNVYLNILN